MPKKFQDIGNDYNTKTYPFFFGGLAACIAAGFTHPLDCAKFRMQTGPSHSMFQTLIRAIQEEGVVKGAFAGLSASFLRQLTYSVIRFGVYDTLKLQMARRSAAMPSSSSSPSSFSRPTRPSSSSSSSFSSSSPSTSSWSSNQHATVDVNSLSALQMAIAASFAGFMGGFAGNPADVVLVRMAGDLNKPPDRRLGYRHAVDGIMRIMREEGASSLFRGLGPNLTRAVLMNASQLASYDTFKQSLLRIGWFQDGLALHFTASSLAGAVATTICSPFDVLKSRIMNQSENGIKAMTVVHESFRKEGVAWLFRGWVPAFARLGPNTVIIFLSLEQIKRVWDMALGR